jgi:hypothetical protein
VNQVTGALSKTDKGMVCVDIGTTTVNLKKKPPLNREKEKDYVDRGIIMADFVNALPTRMAIKKGCI